MTQKSVQIVVSALDRLTAPVRRMNETVARMTAPIRRVNAAVANLGREAGLDKLNKRFRNLGDAVGRVQSRIGGMVASVTGLGALSLGSISIGLLGGVIKTSAQFERFQSVLETILGSQDKAKAAMSWVQQFAKTTPYELGEVTDAFVRLNSYGINAADGTLKSLGDAAAAMNKDLMAAVEMLADVSTGELERLKEFGITGSHQGDIIALAFTDKAGRQRTFTAAKNDARALRQKVLEIFEAKGFRGAAAKLSGTWDGMVSNMKDTFAGFLKSIGDAGAFGYLKSRLQALLERVNAMAENGQLQAWAQRISDAFVRAAVAFESFVRSVDWSAVWQGTKDTFVSIQRFVDAIGGWKNAIIGLVILLNGALIASVIQLGIAVAAVLPAITGAFGALGAMLLANPILAVIAAIAGAVLLIYANWGPISEWFAGLWDGITARFSAFVERFRAMWAGLTGWVAQKVQALTGWMPDWMKKGLGVAFKVSPVGAAVAAAQTVMRPVNAARTVMRPMRTAAVAATALTAQPAFAAVANPGTPPGAPVTRPAAVASPFAAPAPPKAAPPVYNTTINVNAPGGDPAAIQRAVENALRAIERERQRDQGSTYRDGH